MKHNIIFLDIDGVLNRFNPEKCPSECVEDDLIDNLNYLIGKTNAQVVLSSTWKAFSSSLDILKRDLFPKLPDKKIFGITPIIKPQINREVEIQQWISQNFDIINKYVIIDDYDFELKSFIDKGVCVITDALKGLTISDCEKAIKILKEENKK